MAGGAAFVAWLLLDEAGSRGVDIAMLYEEFTGGDSDDAEALPGGPTVRAVAKLAAKHRMYVVCPIREKAGDAQFNSAVIVDRSGHVLPALSGEIAYRKVYPVLGVNPGPTVGAPPVLGGGEPGTQPGPSGVQAWVSAAAVGLGRDCSDG